MAGAPVVSVYLPTRNRAALLSDAIRSVLAQTFDDFELIVVDDASTDDTPRILAEFSRVDARVRGLRQVYSSGAPAARNRAIAAARGEFVTGLDDDDLMRPTRLADLLSAYLNAAGTPSFVCSSFFRERNGRTRRLNVRGRTITLDDLLHGNVVGNQVFTRTEFMREVGGFDEQFVASQDYDLWTRLAIRFGPGLRIARASYVYREDVAGASISASFRFAEGARQYTAKHGARMSAEQLRSQRLVHRITERRRLRLAEVPSCFAWPTLPLLFKYWLKGLLGR